MLIATRTDKKKQETERCKRELKAIYKRIGELSKILTKLYGDAALKHISKERYQAMAPGYEREQELLKGQREKLVVADLQVVTPETGHILDDERRYLAGFHCGNHAVEAQPVERGPGDTVVHKIGEIAEAFFFRVLCEDVFLK